MTSRLVKGGHLVKSVEQRPAGSVLQMKSLKVNQVMPWYQPSLDTLASLQSMKQTSRNGQISTAINQATATLH